MVPDPAHKGEQPSEGEVHSAGSDQVSGAGENVEDTAHDERKQDVNKVDCGLLVVTRRRQEGPP